MAQRQINGDNFHEHLANAAKMDKSLRTLVQDLIVFGFTEYDTNHNSNFLTDIINADFQSVRMAAVQQYVEDHTDLVLKKMKDGTHRFKREAVEGYEFSMPTVNWFEYSQLGKVVIVDPSTVLSSSIKRLEKALDEGEEGRSIAEGKRDEALALLNYLKAAPTVNAVAA